MEYLMPSNDVATSFVNRGLGYGAVGLSSALAFAQSVDAGLIATSIGVVGLAITGVFFEFKRKRRADMLADMEARIELDKRALEAEIALNERREKAYANSLREQLEASGRRIEDANRKLHEIRNEAEAARATFMNDRDDLREQLDHQAAMIGRYEQENRRLMLLIHGKVEATRADIADNTASLDAMKAALPPSSDAIPALGTGVADGPA